MVNVPPVVVAPIVNVFAAPAKFIISTFVFNKFTAVVV